MAGVLGVAAAVVTSPATIASVAIATIVIGCYKIIEANEPVRFRTQIIPKLTDALTRGISDGLHGKNNALSAPTIEDENTTYLAGVYAGMKQRLKLTENKEPFDEKSEQDKQAILSSAKSQAITKMEMELWAAQAESYKGRWLSNSREEIFMQMSAWNNTIGNSPSRRGSVYLNLWKAHRVDDPDSAFYEGNW